MMTILVAAYCMGLRFAHAITAPAAEKIVQTYEHEKSAINDLDLRSREIMGDLYDINVRMKGVSKKRDVLNNQMLAVEGNVKNLTKTTVALENKLNSQKLSLARRLRAIYMIGDEGLAHVIFSSSDTQELEQNLKYLKIISNRDFGIIRSFEANLKKLNVKREALRHEVKRLLALREQLRYHEQLLSKDQGSKSDLLQKLGSQRRRSIAKISGLREIAKEVNIQDMLNLSFFEQKGLLKSPVDGLIARAYGMIENEKFRYRLGHKGLSYQVSEGSEVKTIFNGMVSFVGAIEGYGKTIIIDHGDHYYSVYANAKNVAVNEGQQVATGQLIAKSLDSFYFEIRHFSESIDPENWIK